MNTVTQPPMLPIQFKRGSTFSYVFSIPTSFPNGYFREWEVISCIRKAGDSTIKGAISTLNSRWQDDELTRELVVFDLNTSSWPIGEAEMDIVFISSTGYRLPSKTIIVNIQNDISTFDYTGENGPELDLQFMGTLLAGSPGTPGQQGDPGPRGFPGPTGKSTYEAWIDAGNVGSEADFLNSISGPPGANGDDGDDGREVELQKSATHVQWRYTGSPTWTNLIALVDLKGDQGDAGDDGDPGVAGPSVELQKTATHIQWRVVGSPTWIDLVALSDISGDAGDIGTDIQAWNQKLDNFSAADTPGIVVQTALDTFAARSVVGTTNEIEVTHGDGIAGDIQVGLHDNVSITGSVLIPNYALYISDYDATHHMAFGIESNLTDNRTFTFVTGDNNRRLDMSASDVIISAFAATYLNASNAANTKSTLGMGSMADQSNTSVNITGGYIAPGIVGGLGTAAVLNVGTSAGQIPVLDGSGFLDTSIIPAIAITDVFTVASQAAMLALTAQKGDIAIRSDLNKSFALSTNSPGTLADWKELLTPTDTVVSVAGLTGTISGSALKGALAITEADVSGLVTDLALKAALASPALTGTPTAPTAGAGTNTTQLATTAFVTTADNLKADLASPALTGTPTAPTASGGTNTTQIATTAFVTSGLAGKANTSHTHAQSDVTNLVTDLAAKAPLASPALTGTPTAPTAAAVTNTTQVATTAMVQSAIANYVAVNDVEVFKGFIDCSANPNYPAADAGHVYRVSVAGKIGGASGTNVEVNDRLECLVDSTASGNQATVGSSWMITQTNIDGAVTGPTSATADNPMVFNGTTGKIAKEISYSTFKTNLALTKTDVGLSNVDNTSNTTERAATRTLTNASLVDNSTDFVDETDATKKAQLVVDTVATATRRYLIVPDRSGVLVTDPTSISDIMPSLDLNGASINGMPFKGNFTRSTVGGYRTNSKGIMVPTVANEPLIDFASDGTSLGAGFFSSYTNLLLRSDEFDNASWSKINVTVTANSMVGPDGATTMDTLDATVASGVVYQFRSMTVGSTALHTAGVFLKPGTAASTILRVTFTSGGTDSIVEANVTWSTKAVSLAGSANNKSYTFTQIGSSGIYLLTVTGSNGGGANTLVGLQVYAAAGGTGTVYASGAQLTQTAYPVPYIPTTSATVTRNADSMIISGTDFTDFYNQTEGTIYIDADIPYAIAGASIAINFSDGTNVNRNIIYLDAVAMLLYGITTISSSNQAAIGIATTRGLSVKFAYTYKLNAFAACINGGTVSTDTSGTVPTTIDRLDIGSSWDSHIRRAMYWPRALSNNQIQRMTL